MEAKRTNTAEQEIDEVFLEASATSESHEDIKENTAERTNTSSSLKTENPVTKSSSSGQTETTGKCNESVHADGTSLNSSPRASMDQALKSEKAFIEYVMSLPSAPVSKESPTPVKNDTPSAKVKPKTCTVITVASNTTKIGLDHLDNLCKLMEQLSDLRETNTKLQKRVQYLEDLKTLHEMHKEIRRDVQYGSENILIHRRQIGLKKSMTSTDYARSSPRGSEDYAYQGDQVKLIKNRRSPSSRRSRATTNSPYDGHRRERSKSVGHEEVFDGKSKRIFPKWSKVKEAFGWESERKDSAKATSKFYYGTSGAVVSNEHFLRGNRRIFTDNDIAALRIPLYSEYLEKDENSTMDEEAATTERYHPDLNSSAEDISGLLESFRPGTRNSKRDSESSEKRLSLLEPPSDGLRRQKSTPSPGSDRVRAYHEMLELKPKSLTIERDIDAEQSFAKYEKEDSKKSHKSPWGRVKTIIERRRDSLRRRHLRRGPEQGHISPHPRAHTEISNMEEDDAPDGTTGYNSRRKSSDDQFLASLGFANYPPKDYRYNDDADKIRKRKKQTISIQDREQDRLKNVPPPIQSSSAGRLDPVDSRISPQIPDRDVGTRTPSSTPPFHRKSRWMRVKKVLRGKKEEDGNTGTSSHSMPSSPNGIHDGTFDFEDADTLEDNSRELDCYEGGREITRVGSDSFVHKLSLSTSVPVSNIMLELQRNLSEDFNRKMQEWEHIRNTRIRPTTSPKWERKNSGSKTRKKPDKPKPERYEKSPKHKIKDLTWLEKELQKIEKEKQRLSKEKQKYEERAIRLERLRETVLSARNTNKKEVLVRTSAGEFRFEGISDAFTKKLYEWETKRGLGPELSTIALLDSSLGAGNKSCLTIQQVDKCGNLQRGMSRSESSLAEIGQPSHTSSNSLPSLKPPDAGDIERIHHHSRANSEPDLSSFVTLTNSGNATVCSLTKQEEDILVESSRDSLGAEPRDSYAHPEVTQLIDSDVEGVLGELEERRQDSEQREENYYSLLEENVILLEQLKNKEEICRRLEKELELLDEKVDEMNSHHQQEMELYREKLWEMHKPGNTPREVQGCLQIMSELRSRIESLEKCSERLRNDRETLEDSFRFHSAEQEHMTLDLLDKMRELQAAGGETGETSQTEKKTDNQPENSHPSFDIKIVERLQDLSSQLVKQTRELEQTLTERTRQICQLRWELLHRDVSTVRLETELHSAHIQGSSPRNRAKCDAKRSKYAHFRSWSSEEASSRARQESRLHEVERPSYDLQEAYYNKLPKTEFQASDLSSTVQELNRELIRLSTAAESFLGEEAEGKKDDKSRTAEKEKAVDSVVETSTTKKEESDNPLIPSSKGGCEVNSNVIPRNEARVLPGKISVRRNSAGNISVTSGVDPGGSESSSLTEEIIKSKMSPVLRRRSESTASSDSENSSEESFTRVVWCHPAEKPKMHPIQQEIALKYPSFTSGSTRHLSSKHKTKNDENRQKDVTTKTEQLHKSGKNSKQPNTKEQYPGKYDVGDTSAESCSVQGQNGIIMNNQSLPHNKHIPEIPKETITSKSRCLRQCQSADMVTSDATRSSQSEQKSSQKHSGFKKQLQPLEKSYRDRASDSKIPLCSRACIKKSESLGSEVKKSRQCCVAERSKSSREKREIFANQRLEQQRKMAKVATVDESEQGSLKKKPSVTGIQSKCIASPEVAKIKSPTENILKTKRDTNCSTDHIIIKSEETTNAPFSENAPKSKTQQQTLKRKLTPVVTQEPPKTEKIAISQLKVVTENTAFKKYHADCSNVKVQEIVSSKGNKRKTCLESQQLDTSGSPEASTVIVKLPKRKNKIPEKLNRKNCTKNRREIQNNFEANKDLNIINPVEETITVVIPRKSRTKLEENQFSVKNDTITVEKSETLKQATESVIYESKQNYFTQPAQQSFTDSDITIPSSSTQNHIINYGSEIQSANFASRHISPSSTDSNTTDKDQNLTNEGSSEIIDGDCMSQECFDHAFTTSLTKDVSQSVCLDDTNQAYASNDSISAQEELLKCNNELSCSLPKEYENNCSSDSLSQKTKVENPRSNNHETRMSFTQASDQRKFSEHSNDSTKTKHKLKQATSEDVEENNNYGCFKSPSAPQLDWKKTCAKKISREGAPNVKNLIEKYNQKVLENQSPKSPRSTNFNSPVTCRKTSAPQNRTETPVVNIPSSFSSTPNSPRIISASTFYNPLTFKPANLDLFQSTAASPPTSPASKARSEALLKAKEKFISSSSIITFTPQNQPATEYCELQNSAIISVGAAELSSSSMCRISETNDCDNSVNTTKRSATDSDINRRQKNQIQKSKTVTKDVDRTSICSNKSMDSMSLVVYRTGESCQESRLSRRGADCDRQKNSDSRSKTQESDLKSSKSLSNSSLFKTVTGHDIKLPSSFLRLRRSRRKKDMATVSTLCRQSLLIGEESESLLPDDAAMPKSPRSCPSSPELKSKSKSKTSWLHRSLFRHK